MLLGVDGTHSWWWSLRVIDTGGEEVLHRNLFCCESGEAKGFRTFAEEEQFLGHRRF